MAAYTRRNVAARPLPVRTGTATLVAGQVTVSDTNTTIHTRVALYQDSLIPSGGSVGILFISAKSAGASFTIKSSSSTDTSIVYYEILSY